MISREASENTNQGNFLTANIISSLYESNIVCFDLIDETSSISKWPTGQYEVPASMYGCPEITWTMRYINLTLPSDDIFWTSTGISFDYIKIPDKGIYNHSRDMHILGPYSTSSFQFNFCSRNDIDSNLSWPIGNYCVFGVGNECPNGKSYKTFKIY